MSNRFFLHGFFPYLTTKSIREANGFWALLITVDDKYMNIHMKTVPPTRNICIGPWSRIKWHCAKPLIVKTLFYISNFFFILVGCQKGTEINRCAQFLFPNPDLFHFEKVFPCASVSLTIRKGDYIRWYKWFLTELIFSDSIV